MGCGALMGPRMATEEQKEEMACRVAKDVCVVCLQHVLDNCVKVKDVKISAPTKELDDIRKMPGELRAQAKSMQDAGKDAGDAVASGAKGLMGGFGGGLMGKVADAVGDATSAVAGAAGAVGGAALDAAADAIEQMVAKLDQEFAEVASEVAAAKTQEIINCYNDIFENLKFVKAMDLCRGNHPHGQAQFDACPKDAITKGFMSVAGDSIAPALTTAVGDAVKKNKIVGTWKSTIDTVNDANNKMAELLKTDKKPAISLDIEKYIVDEIVKAFAAKMNAYEAEVRKDPKDKSKFRQQTFCLILSGAEITSDNYFQMANKQM